MNTTKPPAHIKRDLCMKIPDDGEVGRMILSVLLSRYRRRVDSIQDKNQISI